MVWKASYKDLFDEFPSVETCTEAEMLAHQNATRLWLINRLAADHPDEAERNKTRYNLNYSILEMPARFKFYFHIFREEYVKQFYWDAKVAGGYLARRPFPEI